jgi:hypothetical protein
MKRRDFVCSSMPSAGGGLAASEGVYANTLKNDGPSRVTSDFFGDVAGRKL